MLAVLNSAEVRSHSVGIKGDLRLIDFTWFFCWLGVEVAVLREVLGRGLGGIHLSHSHRANRVHILDATAIGRWDAAVGEA